ncbi:MAG: hypothetical protein WEB30_19105 [Cyclobacteriaceae bacterium]
MLPSVDELKARYSSWSNDRLLSVIHNKEEYTAEAVEVARAELGQRNVSADEVDVFLQEQEELEHLAKILSCIPLRFWEKALFFFVWFAPWFLGGAFRLNYSEDGLLLKVKQSHVFAIGGFIALIADGIITVYLNLGAAASAAVLIFFFVVFCGVERKVAYELRM